MLVKTSTLILGLAAWLISLLYLGININTAGVLTPATLTRPAMQQTSFYPEPPPTRLLFGGQIVPGRCVQAGVDSRGNADYIYANLRDLLQSPDLTIATLNGSLTDVSPSIGCVGWSLILSGTPVQADAMARAGFDALSVATNHINNCTRNNCGNRPFLDTLMNLERVGIVPIGGGETLDEALAPRVFTLNGVRFALVSLGEIEPNVFAGDDRPGIAPLNEENLRNSLQAARRMADVVIFMPHWGSEYSPFPNPSQMKYARLAAAEGANLIIGSHTHVIQGRQKIDGTQVFYGLGNFVFDQSWELRLRSSLLVEVTFVGKEMRDYRVIPVVVAKDGTLSYPDEEDRIKILTDFEQVSNKINP